MLDSSPSSKFSIEFARPDMGDARLVMSWRNDPQTLKSFYHREPKVWETFWPEFRDTYFHENIFQPLFVLVDGEKCAFFRFQTVKDPFGSEAKTCDISINVNPAMRGKGVGAKALQMATRLLHDKGVALVLAEIRVENQSSVRTFEKSEYVRLDQTIKRIADTGEDCQIYRYFHKKD